VSEVLLSGRGMHSGAPSRVILRRVAGESVVRIGGEGIPLREWNAQQADRATVIVAKQHRLRTVEHLFAALGALSVYQSIEIEVEGTEIPLLDGGSLEFARALLSLKVPTSLPPLHVARNGEVAIHESAYRFTVGESRCVRVEIDFGDSRLEPNAEWRGDANDFVARIASARTFAPEKDVAHLLASGLASHVTKESVVVIAHDQILSSGMPFTADEPARHKLIDLMGDLYLYGGPPIGCVEAFKPGHPRTHEAIRIALAEGILSLP